MLIMHHGQVLRPPSDNNNDRPWRITIAVEDGLPAPHWSFENNCPGHVQNQDLVSWSLLVLPIRGGLV
jgi:hypothetical protein